MTWPVSKFTGQAVDHCLISSAADHDRCPLRSIWWSGTHWEVRRLCRFTTIRLLSWLHQRVKSPVPKAFPPLSLTADKGSTTGATSGTFLFWFWVTVPRIFSLSIEGAKATIARNTFSVWILSAVYNYKVSAWTGAPAISLKLFISIPFSTARKLTHIETLLRLASTLPCYIVVNASLFHRVSKYKLLSKAVSLVQYGVIIYVYWWAEVVSVWLSLTISN